MKNKLLFCIFILAGYLSTGQVIGPQGELKKGDLLRVTYRFDQAIKIFSEIIKKSTDSIAQIEAMREVTLCENGKQMLQFAFIPNVIGKGTVPRKNFYAYYDLNLPGYWALTPRSLLTRLDINDIPPFVFTSSETPDMLYFSSRGADGATGWDIYETHRMPNDEWSTPERLSEIINTEFDERFPYMSPDGKTLYFSSTGHYGMGGYNLFRSTLNPVTNEWSIPENLGFPFSSTHDDFLFVPDADGLYACFVSSRDASNDSVSIYKIALEGTPVKQAVTELTEILELERLRPKEQEKPAEQKTASPTDKLNKQYNKLLGDVRKVESLINEAQRTLNQLREEYGSTKNAQEQKNLSIKIDQREESLSHYHSELQLLRENAQQTEYTMLSQGIIPMAERSPEPKRIDQPQPHSPASFVLKPNSVILLPTIVLQEPIIPIHEKDFTFKTHATTEIFYNEQIDGISYQIQTGIFSRKLETTEFHGFTPVFAMEKENKWLYSIGSFATFGEAQKQLPVIKKIFKDALIIAFKDSKSISIKQARTEEDKTRVKKPVTQQNNIQVAYQIMLGEYPSGLPQNLLKTVQQATGKDLARTTQNGKTEYAVGPYSSKTEAENIVAVLQRNGFTNVHIEELKKK